MQRLCIKRASVSFVCSELLSKHGGLIERGPAHVWIYSAHKATRTQLFLFHGTRGD